MKKLLLSALLACTALVVAGCGDREKMAAHRAERSMPKVEVSAELVSVRRAPYPNLDIQPDGGLRVDDIEIPLHDDQRQLLQASFAKLQILRQNALTDAAATASAGERSVPLQAPAGEPVFPNDLAQRIPEFRQYGQALANLRAVR